MRLAVFLIVFILFLGQSSAQNGLDFSGQNEILWQQYLDDLHWSVESRDYYAAKQALTHLEALDLEKFTSLQLSGTRAWVAMMEGNWATAAREYGRTLEGARRPRFVLERALCLQKLGRYEEALKDLDSIKKSIKDRKLSWEWACW